LTKVSRRKEIGVKKTIIIGCLVTLLVGCIAVAGCGSGGDESVQGVYKLKAGEDSAATVTLKADNQATYSITEGGGVPVTYKVKGDTVVLSGMDGKEIAAATFKITKDGLTDPSGNIYKKQ
jgi:hypothetical protein